MTWTYKGLLSDDGANPDLSNLSSTGEDHFLKKDFTIIYPNGGTVTNPANISANSTYIESNPFPGYAVYCKIEVLYNGSWNDPGWASWNNASANDVSFGAYVSQNSDGDVKIITARWILGTANNPSMIPTLHTATVGVASVPSRVKVWKIGKVASA